METEAIQSSLFLKLEHLSRIVSNILSFQGIVILIVAFLAISTAVFFFQSFYKTSLLIASASGGKKRISVIAVFSSLFEAFEKIVHNLFVLLPIFAGVIIALVALTGIMHIAVSLNKFVEREKRIRELSIAIKYLEQSEKVCDVRILSVENGATRLRLNYDASNPNDSSIPSVAWRKEITIQGTDIYFDCMVLNFSYSEITSGRQKNIAIPYRIFSNTVPAEQGVYLHKELGDIPEEDDFGFIPPVYKERLLQLLTDGEFAREMGVRSVNGSALHRYAFQGDRYKIRIHQLGGISFE